MTTRTQIMEALSNRPNWRTEKTIDRLDREIIGINFGKSIWYWLSNVGDDVFIFDHAYSQNTGKVMRGTTARWRIYHAVEKAANK